MMDVGALDSDDPPPLLPPISMSFKDKVSGDFGLPWRTAVILKLMGRPLSYAFLRTFLLHKWDLKGPMSLIDLENNYFFAKFLLVEDMRYVLSGGPWQIAGQYVVTQQ
ncbi:PREDICTED: reverse mRNAase [Prunus dulcis]|uniref:PREDICTED: reverse mRNAase n=1 Tax=Prunus dulcis TaxID=3755 RepID=A0A5E4FV73_PRUDU|nr:PREDICTED: reverse mRNAase [Prunus dulcis]